MTKSYNVEWSTELYVPQAQDEYIKAWVILSPNREGIPAWGSGTVSI
jgi:hypothetical protein